MKITILKTRIEKTNERAIGAFIDKGNCQVIIPLMAVSNRSIKKLRDEICEVLEKKEFGFNIVSQKALDWANRQ
jgi:hypothetical protein